MTDPSQLRNLILSLDGVHTVYPADPAWKATARRIRAALASDAGDASPEYVRLSTEGTATTVSVRVGADGTVPAAELARSIAAALRAELDGEHPRGTVNLAVEISSIRHAPALPGTGPTP
ncbi:hypothetical protein ACX80S_11725 [Arthrobacter sp. RHLT1-20]